MTAPVSLAEVKAHLRLDEGMTGDDVYLGEVLVPAAIRLVELNTGRFMSGDAPTLTDGDLAIAKQAVLLIVGLWFSSREIGADLPVPARWILSSLKKWADGAEE